MLMDSEMANGARFFHGGKVTVWQGDSREVLAGYAADSFDSVVTDPPYALVSIARRYGAEVRSNLEVPADKDLTNVKAAQYKRLAGGFMGQKWDTGETAFAPAFWAEVLRVLKPGGHILAFSGTRTYHRLACAIEDAGFEIRDMVSWVYGSGFPKSHNAGNGWGTALKPALEPIVLARKPLIGTVAANVLKHGTGAINIDGCRVAADWDTDPTARGWQGQTNGAASFQAERVTGGEKPQPNNLGRWPANVIHDGSEEVTAGFPDSVSSGGINTNGHDGEMRMGRTSGQGSNAGGLNDSGSAARFFYTAKADSDDRIGSKHPTVKPVDLMRYLCRLITPPGGMILDPFAGTGTTGEAAFYEGFRATLIEREPEYMADIERRMALCMAGPEEKNRAIIKAKGLMEESAGPLFEAWT